MSSNADFDALEKELRALRQADGTVNPDQKAVLVARLVPGFTLGRWREFLRRYPTGRWCALPVGTTLLPESGASRAASNAPSHLAHLLLAEMFAVQIQRELLRLSRTGGDLVIIETSLCSRELLVTQLGQECLDALDAHLVACLQQCREDCDSLGCTGLGRYALLLPGVSVLRARLMAEQAQKAFSILASQTLSSVMGKNATTPGCAFGIACADQGGRPSPSALLQQAEKSLHEALAQKHGHISISGGAALDKRATLVHSSEKRFLFFGGN